MTSRKRREKVVAEITATYLIKVMQKEGRVLDEQQALAFLNEGSRAYIMWKQMMYAGETYIKAVLAQSSQGRACVSKSGSAALARS